LADGFLLAAGFSMSWVGIVVVAAPLLLNGGEPVVIETLLGADDAVLPIELLVDSVATCLVLRLRPLLRPSPRGTGCNQ
jgi:hypothetical protein